MKRSAVFLIPGLLGAFVCAMFATQSVYAQQASRRADDASKRAQKWAVLMGVDQYVNGPKMRYCTEDATALVGGLTASGFSEQQVFALTDNVAEGDQASMYPTKGNIEKALDLVLSLPEKDDLLVVGYFGAGVQMKDANGTVVPYLCPRDGNLSDVNTLVPLADIYSRLENCEARYKVLILDTNRESLRNTKLPEGVEFLDVGATTKPFGVQILASTSANEVSFEDENLAHGVFANFLLEGMKDPSSGADLNGDGDVSIQELYYHAKTRTKAWVARNYFSRQQVVLYGETSSNFSFCTPTAIRRMGNGDQRVLPLGASLQKAIGQALPNSRIIVAEGVCNLPSTVVIDRPVEIVGESSDRTVFTCDNGAVFDIRSKGVVIRNLGVKGLGSRGPKPNDFDSAICVRNSDARIIGCTISSEVRNGVYAMVSQSQPVLVRCMLADCHNTGVRASGGSKVTVRECMLSDNKDSGISVAPFTRAIVEHTTIRKSDVGLDVDRMGNVDFVDLDFQKNGDTAVRVVNAPVIGLSGRGENVLSVVRFKNSVGPYSDSVAAGSHSLVPVNAIARASSVVNGGIASSREMGMSLTASQENGMSLAGSRDTGMNVTSLRPRGMVTGGVNITTVDVRNAASRNGSAGVAGLQISDGMLRAGLNTGTAGLRAARALYNSENAGISANEIRGNASGLTAVSMMRNNGILATGVNSGNAVNVGSLRGTMENAGIVANSNNVNAGVTTAMDSIQFNADRARANSVSARVHSFGARPAGYGFIQPLRSNLTDAYDTNFNGNVNFNGTVRE